MSIFKFISCVLVVVYVLQCSASSTCFVRVNQVGYPSASDMTAVVLCSGSIPSSTAFHLVNAQGSSVSSGQVGSSQGSWSTSYPNTYKLHFTSTVAGAYTLTLASPATASPQFQIDTPENLYPSILSDSVFFYRAQRDGPDQISSVLNRKPSHLTDAQATVYNIPTYKDDVLQGNLVKIGGPVDVSGGWFDAGDYIKFVETASYVVDVMLLAVRDHPQLFAQGGNADFYTEAQFGIDWLLKMYDYEEKILYFQVGIGDGNDNIVGDHDLWRLPEADDALKVKVGDPEYFIKYRPVFSVGNKTPNSSISPNLAGRVAAAFALCYQVYNSSNPSLASQCLSYGEDIFALANTKPTGKLITAAPFDYYPESEWRDDLELGATELYYATTMAQESGKKTLRQASYYLSVAQNWAKQYISNGDTDSINLYDVSGIAHYELWKALNASGAGGPISPQDLVNAIKEQLDVGVGHYTTDPFGFCDQYDSGDDLVPQGFGYALLANYLSEIDPSSAPTYASFEASQVDWLFGKNAWGSSFMIGAGSVFSECPQHQVANLAGNLNGTKPILLGGVSDGPSQTDNFSGLGTPDGARKCPPNGVDSFKAFTGKGVRYMDNVGSWPSVEPADDYSVLPVLLFARYIDQN